jgi:hypothetical protein
LLRIAINPNKTPATDQIHKKLTYQAQVGYVVPESSRVVELKVLNFALIFKNRLIKKIFPL